MARGEIKAASVAWVTADELAPAQRVRVWSNRSAVQAGQKAAASRNMSAEAYWEAVAGHSSTVIPIPPPAQSAEEKEQAAPTVLIAAYVDLGRRDSLGRGLDAGSVAAAVAADRVVQRERDALPQYCAGPIAICTLLHSKVAQQPGPHRCGSKFQTCARSEVFSSGGSLRSLRPLFA